MIIDLIYFIVGLVLLYYGSDWFVLGAERIAKFFNVSNFVIGATVVAIGTSLPEIVTSIYAAFTNSGGIAVGNAIGSCVCNIGLILGTSLLFSTIILNNKLKRNIVYYIIFIIITFILGIDGYDKIDGFFLIILSIFYILKTIKDGKLEDNNNENKENLYLIMDLFITIIGLISVLLGSKFLVEGAKGLAHSFGISDFIIGFSLVAFGTSVPELMVSIISAKRKLGGIVLGNILGSNVIDIGFALGLPSIFIKLPSEIGGLYALLILSLLLFIFSLKNKINKLEGIVLLVLYFVFITALYFGIL